METEQLKTISQDCNPLRLGPGSVPGEMVRVHLGAVIASYMTIMRTSLGPNHKLFLWKMEQMVQKNRSCSQPAAPEYTEALFTPVVIVLDFYYHNVWMKDFILKRIDYRYFGEEESWCLAFRNGVFMCFMPPLSLNHRDQRQHRDVFKGTEWTHTAWVRFLARLAY